MFENFLTNKNSWLNGKGPSSEIVFSSRVRLARNFSDIPFPSRASATQKEHVRATVEKVADKLASLEKSMFVRMESVDDIDRQLLLERHLISQEHAVSPKSKGLIVTDDERIALMVNEEDHLRLQVITSGFDLTHCWNIACAIDDDLDRAIDFAFLPDLGYLTACPTNAGTALRASCMLHIPALVLTKRINKILELLIKISFTARGLFGEGTQALGDFFQISNQGSLGLSEAEIIDNLSGVVNQVKDQEIASRDSLLKKYKFSLQDNVWRAFGILKNCRLIGSKEALSHLSMLSLGLDLGIIKGIRRELINNLFLMIQPAHLQKIESKPLKEEERDYIRASILRERLVLED